MKSNSIGPALGGIEAQWDDKGKLHEWIRNNIALTASGYPKAVEVSKLTPVVMTPFEDLTDAQIDNILAYIDAKFTGKLDQPAPAAGAAKPATSESQNNWTFAIVTLVLALIA
ncbi:MAG TPA: cytochrome C, partial [Niabella sp.]|nr:cytochrome C [Niabella sp.]